MTLRVHDAAGRVVRTLLEDAHAGGGPHEIDWDGRDDLGRALASGAYLYTLEVGGRPATRKLTLLR